MIRGVAVLCGLLFLTSWLTIGWIQPQSSSHALRIGVLWLLLTLAFEFLAGHYGFGKPRAVLLEDYAVTKGRIWVAVPVVILLAPLLTARWRGLLSSTN